MMRLPFMAYAPTGRKSAEFLGARNRVDAIMGPIGSAKTSAGLMKRVYIAGEQRPAPNGVRYTKHAVIRQTTRELEKTTIPSWLSWVPKEFGTFTGGSGGVMARHHIQFQLPDHTTVDMVMEFFGLGDNRIEDVMRGWEGTTGLQDEADLQAPDAMTFLLGRLGRYPKMDIGGPTHYGLDQMFNAPDTENYLYARHVENPIDGERFYRQPGGLLRVGTQLVENPHAENLQNLPPGYYLTAARGQPDWYVRRMILNEFGYSRDGLPVYPEYDDSRHCSPVNLEPIDAELVIGADAELHPAIVIGQRDSFGQIRVLDELVAPPEGMGAERFGPLLVDLLSEDRYRQFKRITCYYDPASRRSGTDEQHWAQVMAAKTKDRGCIWRPAMTNNLTPRLECVRAPIMRTVLYGDRAQPGLLISPRCKVLRKGFNYGYRMKRYRDATGRVSDEPEKSHPFSDVHDALQYLAQGLGEYDRVLGRDRRGQAVMQSRSIDDGDPGHWERAPSSPFQPPRGAASTFDMRQDSAIDD